jgi:bacterioferritin
LLATHETIRNQAVSWMNQEALIENALTMASNSDCMPLDQEEGNSNQWQIEVIRLLKESLITKLVCIVRYNHLSEGSHVSPLISAEFLLHAYEELAHAHKLARRIAQLGGELEHSPNLLKCMDKASHQDPHDMQSMIEANLRYEYKAIVNYSQIIAQMEEEDVGSKRLLEEIVNDEREYAEELKAWLIE